MPFDIDDALEYMGLRRADSGGGFGSFLVGIGVGAAVGAGVALLLSPNSGAENRKALARATDDLRSQVNTQLQQIQQRVGNAVPAIDGVINEASNTLAGGASSYNSTH